MDPTLAWARNLFRRYYRREPVLLPPRFGRREYGFIFPGVKGMQRHTSFATREELSDFLAREGPNHAYYSAAYYEQPDASQMEDKIWKGADLIFDLDADHLPGAEEMSQREMLEQVRVEAVKVAQEFLIGHFGFEPDDLRIAFSGGRGYHIHVTDPCVHPLGSHGRREIVDYVTGNGLAVERLLHRRTFSVNEVAGHASEKQRWDVSPADTPGWPGLFTRTLIQELEELGSMERDAAVQELVQLDGVGEATADKLLDQLTPERIDQVGQGRVDQIPALANKRVLTALAERTRLEAIGEADEPVTADVKRLIRLPGSLHGKTGLRVTPLTVGELASFDPLRDAIALPDTPVELVLEKPVDGWLAGQGFELEPGEHQLPTYLAAFIALPTAGTTIPWRPRVRTGVVA